MMAKEPRRRFQTPGDVAQALAPFFRKPDLEARAARAEVPRVGETTVKREEAAPRGSPAPSRRPTTRTTVRPPPLDPPPGTARAKPSREGSAGLPATPVAPAPRPWWLWPSAATGVLLLGLVAVGIARMPRPTTRPGPPVPEPAKRVVATAPVVDRTDSVGAPKSKARTAPPVREPDERVGAIAPVDRTESAATPKRAAAPKPEIRPAPPARNPGRRLGDLGLVDRTVPAGRNVRLNLGAAALRIDPPRNGPPGRLRLTAPFRSESPVLDGKIGSDGYGPPLAIDFTDNKNPGLDIFYAPNPARSPDDLSAELYLAYTTEALFVAVAVRDDVLIDRPAARTPSYNDAVELFIDGDRLGGDLGSGGGNEEGFQAASTADRGVKYGIGIGDGDYDVKTSTFAGGYIVEFLIPLRTIDVADGDAVTPPGPGATLRFNLAIVDNDEPVNRQQRYVFLWSDDRTKVPFLEGDGAWPVNLYLAYPVKYELVDGPKGATLDPETNVLTWSTPKQPMTTHVTVRARDVLKPEITAEARFAITTRRARP